MSTQKNFRNPFYVLLLLVGLLFLVTVCGYAVMTVRGMDPMRTAAPESASGRQLVEFMDAYGFELLMIELTILAVISLAAVATDQYWMAKTSTRPAGGEIDQELKEGS